eukprot:Hpha_TRINITY_DN29640_c0_g1::TRINITY_DN29640_c0_g1_i1::g.165138::m.165138
MPAAARTGSGHDPRRAAAAPVTRVSSAGVGGLGRSSVAVRPGQPAMKSPPSAPLCNSAPVGSVAPVPVTPPRPAAATPPRAGKVDCPKVDLPHLVDARSASAMGYFADPLLRYIVKKPERRKPAVNWFTHVLREAVKNSLAGWVHDVGTRVQVVNLCAGWDTLGPTMVTEQPTVSWYDLDDASIISLKAAAMAAAIPAESHTLGPAAADMKLRGSLPSECVSQRYFALAARLRDSLSGRGDLRADAGAVIKVLEGVGAKADIPTILLGPGAWLRTGAVLVEQLLSHFKSLAVLFVDEVSCPDAFARLSGMSRAGDRILPPYPRRPFPAERALPAVGSLTLAEAVLTRALVQMTSHSAELRRLVALEPFDSWEDLWEACRHYTLTVGSSKAPLPPLPDPIPSAGGPMSDFVAGAVEPLQALRRLSHCYTGWGQAATMLYPSWAGGKGILFVFYGTADGGQSISERVVVYDTQLFRPAVGAPGLHGIAPLPRVDHRVAAIGNGSLILFGGRTSQDTGGDSSTYTLDSDTMLWTRVADGGGPSARWRHMMCSLGECGQGEAMLFGGTSEMGGDPLGDAWIWNRKTTRWQHAAGGPPPRHSGTLTFLKGRGCVILHGGIGASGRPLGDTWVFRPQAGMWEEVRTATAPPPRFSHAASAAHRGMDLLIVGGSDEICAKDGVPTAVLLTLPDGPLEGAHWRAVNFHGIGGAEASSGDSAVLLTRHQLIPMSDDQDLFACLGGGAQCMNHGVFLSQSRLFLLGADPASPVSGAATPPIGSPRSAAAIPSHLTFEYASRRTMGPLENVPAPDAARWRDILSKRTPIVVNTQTEFGSCVDKWTPEYFVDKLGDKQVSVSVSDSCRLTFVPRNYSFEVMKVKDLIAGTFGEARSDRTLYFRSVGENMRKESANFWKSFPEIEKDFRVPAFLESTVAEHGGVFSSVLRTSTRGVVMWLHYDVMDNVLFQVRGTKRVLVFPPSAVGDLYLEGSSSRAGDITCCDTQQFPRVALALRQAYHCVLQPGDMLYIPALWCHTVCAVEPSISINMFWRSSEEKHYDRKDLYGNKDPTAAQKAAEHCAKLRECLSELPEEFRDFYARMSITSIREQFCPADDDATRRAGSMPSSPHKPRLYAQGLAGVPALSMGTIPSSSG